MLAIVEVARAWGRPIPEIEAWPAVEVDVCHRLLILERGHGASPG